MADALFQSRIDAVWNVEPFWYRPVIAWVMQWKVATIVVAIVVMLASLWPASKLGSEFMPELEEGDGVKHQVFGMGTVLELDGDNATIFFKGRGTKKLNIAFAPLEKI